MSAQTVQQRNGSDKPTKEDGGGSGGGRGGGGGEVEDQKKYKYPKSVFFIIVNEFCERFSYYGMRAILALYFQYKLRYTETEATLLYHSFLMLCYFFPLFGGVLADSYLGKYRTILYLSVVYAFGSVTVAYASTGFVPLSESTLSMIGLLLIAIGTGGIKPCVSSFGGDQFVIPGQEHQLRQFFSIFYFSINAGSLISTFLTPELRQGVRCLGQDTCYPLAFGIPAVLMVVSLLIFVAGKGMYKMKQPSGNIIVDVTKCSIYAVKQKISSKEKKEHWLDYASGKFSRQLISDMKILMSIILLFSPTVLFWSLYEQQGTSWTFQATRMNGELGSFTIKPDQMQVVNPVLILVFIPLFESIIYPLLAKLRLVRTSLQKLTVGGLLVALAFAVAGILEISIQPTYAVLPNTGEAQLRLINGLDCNVTAKYQDPGGGTTLSGEQAIEGFGILQLRSLKATGTATLKVSLTSLNCPLMPSPYETNLELTEKQSVTYFLKSTQGAPTLSRIGTYDEIKKAENGSPKLRIVYKVVTDTKLTLVEGSKEMFTFNLLSGSDYTALQDIKTGRFQLRVGTGGEAATGTLLPGEIDIHFAGVYTLFVEELADKTIVHQLYTLTEPNSIHILWQLPQIIILTMAEIMFSITGVEFSYSQAPKSMKSVISSLWLLTDSLGNLIVVFMAELLKFDSKVIEFFTFGGLMVIVMLVFALLAMRYTYVTPATESDEDEEGMEAVRQQKVNQAFDPDE